MKQIAFAVTNFNIRRDVKGETIAKYGAELHDRLLAVLSKQKATEVASKPNHLLCVVHNNQLYEKVPFKVHPVKYLLS